MGKINVLITSAGRRVRLVENFKLYANVFTCDMNPSLSAACQVSDYFFKVPRVTDKNYIDFLLQQCKNLNINMIVPTIDPELEILAKNKENFKKEGIFIAGSSENICKTFALKSSTYKFFKENGFLTPEIVDDIETAKYPLFAKLNNSSLSVGAQKVNSIEEAKILLSKNKNYVFQEYIDATEFTVDVFINKKGAVISIVPRERIEVRCGEINKGRTKKDSLIISEVKRLCNKLNEAYGVLTIQLFKKDNKIYFIEINPRFGGGYPLSWQAGADYAKFLIDDYLGKELKDFEEWKDNLIMLRYDNEVLIDGNSI
ncbi:ATP-grasp domain-containing protein [Lebetimonas sp. JH369]|uniref:ATP-grasp domain-containing protein n=1 Tax=Lebetimonas sp. JH369 TaxID=990069 RepID=UPI00046581DD|nr:ATP-grasp domain-containing protein [Lebetimonas sp. JH369]